MDQTYTSKEEEAIFGDSAPLVPHECPPAYTDAVVKVGKSALEGEESADVLVVQAPYQQVIVRHSDPGPSSTCAIVYSCIVFWMFCWPLGLAAFCVALGIEKSQGDHQFKRTLLRRSIGLSVTGTVLGLIIMAVYIYMVATRHEE